MRDEQGKLDTDARLTTHEKVCAERYLGINAQLRRLEGWFVTMVAGLIGLMATIIIKVT